MSSALRWRVHGRVALLALALAVAPKSLPAQQTEPHDYSHHGGASTEHLQHGTQSKTGHLEHRHAPAAKSKSAPGKRAKAHTGIGSLPSHSRHRGHSTSHETHAPAEHGEHDQHGGMKGFFGAYPMTREGSGTSWLPDTTPHDGIHGRYGEWNTMWHALFNLVYDNQGGPRGGQKTFVNGMFMGMAQRPVGEDGTFGLRTMLAPDPFMGKAGYPLLLASGETADGRTHLIDRQHPHDLFMELAATYSHRLSPTSSVFLYAGLPGEPALGPSTFMHRTSGIDIPEAPITHHWLDSTHITFGVVTAGLVLDKWKMEASAFRGREPDQYRFDIEAPKLDSFSARISWNPIAELSMQVSAGHLHSPEQLMPEVNEDRITASATYTQPFGTGNFWSTTAAWGRKILRPGETLDGFLLETAVILEKTYTLFARAESVDETELHHDVPGLDGKILTVGKVSVGGIWDFYRTEHVKLGIGALISKYWLPTELAPLYGSDPTSGMVFARLKVIG